MPQKDTLERAAYTCMLLSYRRLSSQFQFSLSGVTLVYLSQWPYTPLVSSLVKICTLCAIRNNIITIKQDVTKSLVTGARKEFFLNLSTFDVDTFYYYFFKADIYSIVQLLPIALQ